MKPRLKQIESGGASSGQLLSWNSSTGLWAPRTHIFGTEYDNNSSDGSSSTAGVTWVQKLRLTTASLPAGDYFIGWSYVWAHTGGGYGAVRVQVDDSTTLTESYFEATGANNWAPAQGAALVTLSAASHTVDIDFYNSLILLGATWIRLARLVIWRES